MKALELKRIERPQRSIEAARHLGGIAREDTLLAEQEQPDVIARPLEQARRDEGIAAVVARSAQHRDACARSHPAPRRLGNGPPGRLHEIQAPDAAGDCQPVGLAHLVGREQLDRLLQPDRPARHAALLLAAADPCGEPNSVPPRWPRIACSVRITLTLLREF